MKRPIRASRGLMNRPIRIKTMPKNWPTPEEMSVALTGPSRIASKPRKTLPPSRGKAVEDGEHEVKEGENRKGPPQRIHPYEAAGYAREIGAEQQGHT